MTLPIGEVYLKSDTLYLIDWSEYMSRKPRIWYPGAVYHITARGNRRSPIFQCQEDFIRYVDILLEVKSTYPFVLHSYCLMTNHIHLQIETIDHHISLIMKDIHAPYAVYLNKKYGYEGHVFQGRFSGKLIDSPRYFLEVSRYIHRNPLEANMVGHLSLYEWSSYPAYLGLLENPHVNLSRTLLYIPEPHVEQYQLFVEKPKIVEADLERWLIK